MNEQIMLGHEAKDSVTGFQGIVTSITQYLTGCDRIVLTPPSVNGEIKDGASFDINSCDFISEGVRGKFFPSLKKDGAKLGGPEVYKYKKGY